MDVLRSIAGIDVFPVVSLVLFVVVFGGMLLWAARLDPRDLGEMSQLPLDTGADDALGGARQAHQAGGDQ